MAAVNERGLVGRVIEVGRRSARVLLLTDFNSRVPVMVEPSRDQAILAGDNSREPGLIFLPLNPRMAVGQRVVTSGRGGVLPPGLAVGMVSAIGDREGRGRAGGRLGPAGYVRLLEYSRVVPPETLATLQREVYGPPRRRRLRPGATSRRRRRPSDRRRVPRGGEPMTDHLAAPAGCAAARAGAARDRAARGAGRRAAAVPCRAGQRDAARDAVRRLLLEPYRPDLFGAGAAFATGLAHDALAGLPLGLTSLVLLLVRHVVVAAAALLRRPLVPGHLVLLRAAGAGRPGAALGACRCLWWGHLFALQPMVFELLADAGAVSAGDPAARAGAQPDPEDGRCIVRRSGCAASRAARCCSAPASSPCSACWPAGSTICRWSRPTSTRCSPTRTGSTIACCRRRAAWCSTATACRSPATGRPIASW